MEVSCGKRCASHCVEDHISQRRPESRKTTRVQRVNLGRDRCCTVVTNICKSLGERGSEDKGIQDVNPAW